MSEILDTLATCKQVVEWIDPWDERLVIATGLKAPNVAGADRIGWFEDRRDWPRLMTEVKRLIVPTALAACVTTKMLGDEDWATVQLNVPGLINWSQCFPANERTHIFTEEGRKAWAAVGFCCTTLGLGVFSQETAGQDIEARVQLIPKEVTEKLV